DCQKQRCSRRKNRASEVGEIQTIVNATDASGAFRDAFLQKLLRIIARSDDYARCIDKLIKPDLEVSRCENVVRVRGKAEGQREKFVDPESCARCHRSEERRVGKECRSREARAHDKKKRER